MSDKIITGKTRLCGVIGDPIGHTMSPVMHNAAFKELGLDFVYVAFKVKAENLDKAIAGVRGLDIRGLSVTIPHKVNIIPMLDELDPLAKQIGAISTVDNKDGVLIGYNTDAIGFLKALTDKGVDPDGKNVVVLGAGGASRAVSFILANNGSNLSILNRIEELDWAENLARQISETFKKETPALELTEANLEKVLANADILVNTTSVGMAPNVDATPVPARLLPKGKLVFDIVYNPLKTRLRREAEEAGNQTVCGLDMLVCQGAVAFEMWTGHKAPVELMYDEAVKMLEKK